MFKVHESDLASRMCGCVSVSVYICFGMLSSDGICLFLCILIKVLYVLVMVVEKKGQYDLN